MNRRAVAILAASAAVAGAAAGTAIAVGAAGDDDQAAGPKTVIEPATAQQFLPSVAKAMSVTRTPATQIPDDIVSITSRLRGANGDAAHLARKAPDGGAVYVLPSDEGVCLSSTKGVEAGCYDGPVTVTAASVVCAPGLPVDAVEVFGIAPDGIDSVSVALDDGSRRSVAVEGNVYIYRATKADPRPLTISWTGPPGMLGSIEAAVPADFREDRCATPKDLQQAQQRENGATGGPTERSAEDATRELRARR